MMKVICMRIFKLIKTNMEQTKIYFDNSCKAYMTVKLLIRQNNGFSENKIFFDLWISNHSTKTMHQLKSQSHMHCNLLAIGLRPEINATRIRYMIISRAKPTVCPQLNAENFQGRLAPSSMASSSSQKQLIFDIICYVNWSFVTKFSLSILQLYNMTTRRGHRKFWKPTVKPHVSCHSDMA